MTKAATVSVLMPVFNGAPYLREAIESVLGQSYGHFEFIIVDDGSTDESPQILHHFANVDPRIRLLSKMNSGISDTLNLGLHEASGDWIVRLDADDLMLPNRIERQLEFARADSTLGGVGSFFDIIDEEGRIVMTIEPLPQSRVQLAELMRRRRPIPYTHPTTMFRRDVALALNGYRKIHEPCEDMDLFGRMILCGRPLIVQPEVLTRYRVHCGSISRQRTKDQVLRAQFIAHNFYQKRDGKPELDYETYLRRRSGFERIRHWVDLFSEMQYRCFLVDWVGGRPASAMLHLSLAAAAHPWRAARRAARQVFDA